MPKLRLLSDTPTKRENPDHDQRCVVTVVNNISVQMMSKFKALLLSINVILFWQPISELMVVKFYISFKLR